MWPGARGGGTSRALAALLRRAAAGQHTVAVGGAEGAAHAAPAPRPGPGPDEWGWMDAASPRLAAHLAAEASYAASHLARLSPAASAYAARAASWFPAAEATVPERVGAFWYWTEQGAGDAGPRLLRRGLTDSHRTPPTLVLDAGAVLADLGAHGDLAAVKLSPCGRWVAALADAGGESVASVRGVGGPELARIAGAAGIEWGGQGTLFFTASPARDGRPSEVRAAAGLVEMGGPSFSSSSASDHPVLLTWRDTRDHLALGRSKDGRWLTATAVRRDAAVAHVLDLSSSPPPPFTRVGGGGGGPGDGACLETFVESDGRGGLLLLTNERVHAGGHGNAEEEAWLGWAPGPAAPPSAWAPLIPRRPGVVVTDIDVFHASPTASTVLLYERNTRCGTPGLALATLGWGAGGGPPAVALHAHPVRPPPGAAAWACIRPGANADPAATTARVIGSSPLAAPTAFDVDLTTGRVTAPRPPPDTASAAAAVAAAASGLRLRRTSVVSHPGNGLPPARVPLTVVEARPKSGERVAAPTTTSSALVVLYGAYGSPLEADFDPLWLTLALDGWSIVLAGVRGGGEGGRAWHAAGRGGARPAAAADAEAAVGWASAGGSRPVVVSAESAGGLLAGHLLLRGGLAGAVLRAPFLDVCTHALGGSGSRDPTQAALAAHEAGEWAAPGDSAAIQAVCPYLRLGVERPPAFPPILITMGGEDARVLPGSVAKWVARWRARAAGSGGGGGGGGGGAPALLELRAGESHAGPLGPDALDVMGLEAAFAVAAAGRKL